MRAGRGPGGGERARRVGGGEPVEEAHRAHIVGGRGEGEQGGGRVMIAPVLK